MSKSSFASEISLGRKELLPHVRSGIVSLVQSEKRKKREETEKECKEKGGEAGLDKKVVVRVRG